MIQLTLAQSFFADYLNILEIINVYRLIVGKINAKKLLPDILAALVIVLLPVFSNLNSLNVLFIIIYLWASDRLTSSKNIVLDSLIAMLNGVVMASLFDLVDHYTYVFFLQGKTDIALLGWLIPINDLIITIVVAILAIKVVRPKLRWISINFPRPIGGYGKLRQFCSCFMYG